MNSFKRAPWKVIVVLVLVASGCTNSGSVSPSESPSPSTASRAAWIACGNIKDEIPGLRNWITQVNDALKGIDLSGLDQSERIVANTLLVLHYDFYPEIQNAVIERAPDIRQQGRGCIESFDQILSANRGIEIAAVQILTCSLNQRLKPVWANESCNDILGPMNVSNAVVSNPLERSEIEFDDPTSAYLQSLRPWEPPNDDSSAYERFLSGSEADICALWSFADAVDAGVLVSLLEEWNHLLYGSIPPSAPGATSPIPAAQLTPTTRTLYYGTDKERKEYKDAILSNFRFAAVAPLGAPRTILGSEPKLQSLDLNTICAGVNERVDIIGRASDDKVVPGSAGDGLIARAYEGYTLCPSGKFGSDTDACAAKRFFGIIPLLIAEWKELHVAFGKLSSFIMISEHGVLP